MSTATAQSTSGDKALGPSITLFPSGRRFFISSPTWDIDDIAWSLGMKVRWGGHIRHFYTVAEHSVIVSLLMKELKLGDPLEGLMHDAHESICGDMLSPLKSECQGWDAFEDRLEADMRAHFALPGAITYGCRQADHIARHIEAWFLKVDRGAEMSDPLGIRHIAMELVEKRHWKTLNLYPQEATAAFLKQWNHLRG